MFLGRIARAHRAAWSAIVWCGRASSWLNLGILASVLTAIVAGAAGANELLSWDGEIPLLGDRLTINGVFDIEWHFFAVTVMLGGAYALLEDRHVRSDFFRQKMPPRWRLAVDVAGDLVFLLPFCAVVGVLSLDFVARSYSLGEKSDYGGLTDRYLIKSVIPIGFGILFAAGALRVAGNIAALARHQ